MTAFFNVSSTSIIFLGLCVFWFYLLTFLPSRLDTRWQIRGWIR